MGLARTIVAALTSGLVLGWAPARASEPAFRATYSVTFEADWSATTHPGQFPPSPHFSPMIGATHQDSARLWREGDIASQGVESMAELGQTHFQSVEVNDLIETGQAEFLLSGGSIGSSPGSVTRSFEITQAFPLVSLTSMLAPSPDWFVGVDSLPLRQNGQWIETLEVDLFVFDAGTDSGASYTSGNADTQPREPIAPITEGPLANGVPVGRFRFELQSVSEYFPIDGTHTGLYFDPDNGGEGVNLTVGAVGDRRVVSLTWYTHRNGQQLWLAGNVDIDLGVSEVVVPLIETLGGRFGDTGGLQAVEWGTATIRFPRCDSVEIDYDGNEGNGTLVLDRLLSVSGHPCP